MIHITHHAIARFQEQVANLPEAEVRAMLDTPIMALAETMGATAVILRGGYRAVIHERKVVTILPPRKRRHHAPRIATQTTWMDETA